MPYCTSKNSNAIHEIPLILYHQNVHYRLHNSQPIVSALSQMNPLDAISNEVNCILILFTYTPPRFFREVPAP